MDDVTVVPCLVLRKFPFLFKHHEFEGRVLVEQLHRCRQPHDPSPIIAMSYPCCCNVALPMEQCFMLLRKPGEYILASLAHFLPFLTVFSAMKPFVLSTGTGCFADCMNTDQRRVVCTVVSGPSPPGGGISRPSAYSRSTRRNPSRAAPKAPLSCPNPCGGRFKGAASFASRAATIAAFWVIPPASA